MSKVINTKLQSKTKKLKEEKKKKCKIRSLYIPFQI